MPLLQILIHLELVPAVGTGASLGVSATEGCRRSVGLSLADQDSILEWHSYG